MSNHFHRITTNYLRLACVAFVIGSVSVTGISKEQITSDEDESITNPSTELALEDWQSEMSRVSQTLTKISANFEKAFEQTKVYLTRVQEAAENFQNTAMRTLATQISTAVEDLSESIPKWSSKWMSRIDRLDNDGDGALTWLEVSVDSQDRETQKDSTESNEKIFVVGSNSGMSSLESEFNYIDRNEDGKVDGAEIDQVVEELESVRQSLQDMVTDQFEPEADDQFEKSTK